MFADGGLGKTSGARTLAAFGGHVARGSTLVHDMENGHNRLVRELGLRSERHNSKLIKRLPDPENPLAAVNRLCYLLRLFLDSHTGFDRTRLGGYLDSSAMMNPPGEDGAAAPVLIGQCATRKRLIQDSTRGCRSDDEESSQPTICKGVIMPHFAT
ncbi:MAG: hypothetical protein ACLTS2_12710 [Eggerthella lenta]